MNLLSNPIVYLLLAICASYALSRVVGKTDRPTYSRLIPMAQPERDTDRPVSFDEMVLRCQKLKTGDFR